MTVASILQPSYLSWPGHFYWMKNCDVFIFLDDVQYTRQDWRNRNYIKTQKGKQLLSVPVHWYGNSYAPINTIEIASEHPWAKKHLQALRAAYGRAPYFREYFPYFEEVFSRGQKMLVELTIPTMKELAGFLGIRPRFAVSSDLNVVTQNSTEKLVGLCRAAGADTYLMGRRGYENYIERRLFEEAGINIIVRDYCPRPYPQLWGEFISHMSVVDLLFNCGPDSKRYLEDQPDDGYRDDYRVFFWKNEYDSRFFKRDVFSFSLAKDEHAPDVLCLRGFKDTGKLPRGLAVGRVAASEEQVIRDAIDAGFEIVCRMTDLELELEGRDASEGDPSVRPARQSDSEAVIEMAGSVFSLTRFHREKTMSPAADDYHREWMKNCLAGEQADIVLVSGEPRPEGFICLAYDGRSREARIVLVGVAADRQRRGTGARLLNASVNWAKGKGAEKLWVRTESDNPALKFYLKNGFREKNVAFYLRKESNS